MPHNIFNRRIITRNRVSFPCKCGKDYTSKKAADLHCKVSHGNDKSWIEYEKEFTCSSCRALSGNAVQLQRYKIAIHKAQYIQCVVLRKNFQTSLTEIAKLPQLIPTFWNRFPKNLLLKKFNNVKQFNKGSQPCLESFSILF